MATRTSCALLAALVWAAPALGQAADEDTDLLAPRLRRIGSEHGLSHNAVHALLQDSAGFLWIGTQDGLNRYEGRDFLVFRAGEGGLTDGFVTSLYEDDSRRIWVGSFGGLQRMAADGATFEASVRFGDRARVIAIAAGPVDGHLWVGTEHGLWEYDPRSGERTALELPYNVNADGDANRWIHDIVPGPDGEVWVVVGDGNPRLARLRGRELVAVHELPAGVESVLPTPDGQVWAAHGGPQPLDSWAPVAPGLRPSERLTAFVSDAAGDIWVASLLNGVSRYAAGVGEGQPIPTRRAAAERGPDGGAANRALTDEVLTAAVDRQGGVWFGTYGGLLRWSPAAQALGPLVAGGVAGTAISTILEDATGELWFGTFGAGLHRYHPGTGRAELVAAAQTPGWECSDYVWDLLERDEDLYVATTAGVCRIRGGRVARVPVDVSLGQVKLAEAAGTLYLATENAVHAWPLAGGPQRELLHRRMHPTRALVAGDALWVSEDHVSGTLTRIDLGTGAVEAWPGIAPAGIWDMRVSQDGDLWLATGAGLARFDRARGELDLVAALGSVAYSLVSDATGTFWVGTGNGLVRVDRGGGAVSWVRYGGVDLLGNIEFNRNAAARLRSGRLLFGGMAGVTVVDPSNVPTDQQAGHAVITHIAVLAAEGGREFDPRLAPSITLRPSDTALTFEFARVDFTGRPEPRFEYRLRGADDAWTDAGPTRTVRYTALPPGEYDFEVRAVDVGAQSVPASVAVRVLPAFWQTTWFLVLAAAVVGAAGTAAYRVRVRHLMDLAAVRVQVARDLHDELGSELSGIALGAGLVADRDYLEAADRDRLGEVGEASRQALDGLRDVTWLTSPEHDTVEAFAARLRQLVHRLLPGVAVELSLPAEGTTRTALDPRVRRDLYLICREALHNIARHAEASQVSVEVALTGRELQLVVRDDGRGFDPADSAAAVGGGLGLRSMRDRAETAGGTFAVDSAPGAGATLRVTLPARPRSRRPEA